MDTVLFVTLAFTINETLKSLSSLAILMQESVWRWQCSDRYSSPFPPPAGTSVLASTSLETTRRWTRLTKEQGRLVMKLLIWYLTPSQLTKWQSGETHTHTRTCTHTHTHARTYIHTHTHTHTHKHTHTQTHTHTHTHAHAHAHAHTHTRSNSTNS